MDPAPAWAFIIVALTAAVSDFLTVPDFFFPFFDGNLLANFSASSASALILRSFAFLYKVKCHLIFL